MHYESMSIGLNELSKINLKPTTLEEALVVINQLAAIIVKLDKTIEDLTEKLNLNSDNSSKPPSTSFNKKSKHKGKGKSGKKRGAQPGVNLHVNRSTQLHANRST